MIIYFIYYNPHHPESHSHTHNIYPSPFPPSGLGLCWGPKATGHRGVPAAEPPPAPKAPAADAPAYTADELREMEAHRNEPPGLRRTGGSSFGACSW